MDINFIIFYALFSIIFLAVCKKYNILIDKKIENHKKYSTKNNSNLLGGILIIFFLSYYNLFIEKNYLLYLFLLSVFFIGLMADIRRINSVSQRFFLQLIIVICFVSLINIEINYTKIKFVDELLEINLVNILFVTFCLLVLINGTNFLDGINGLVITYYIIIFFIFLFNLNNFIFDKIFLSNILYVLCLMLTLNLLGLIYLGDSGSYILSLISGIFLINFASDNNSISPYFVVILLWYPCFELLFSMMRRSLKESKTYKPDTTHLHQIIYKHLKYNSKIKNNLFLHLITTFIINFYNLVCFIVTLKYIYNSKILILIISVNIIVYVSIYNYLKFSANRIERK
mgnify:CR=1 FL=1|tara:strand:- start:496 stop:1524 length:1029 start_codon:yes stop_codon:yes gene_type:complete